MLRRSGLWDPKLACVLTQASVAALFVFALRPGLTQINDSDFFDASGLMLLEVLRIEGNTLNLQVLHALPLLLVGSLLTCLCHLWLMLDELRRTNPDFRRSSKAPAHDLLIQTRSLLDAYPVYLAIHLGSWLISGGFLAGWGYATLQAARRLNRDLSGVTLLQTCALQLLLLGLFLALLVLFDLLKLHISCAESPSRSLAKNNWAKAVLLGFTKAPGSLLFVRLLRLVLSCGFAFCLWLLHRDPDQSGWGASLVTQLGIYGAVLLEAAWYRYLIRRTLTFAQTR